jgi:hypothetical protein
VFTASRTFAHSATFTKNPNPSADNGKGLWVVVGLSIGSTALTAVPAGILVLCIMKLKRRSVPNGFTLVTVDESPSW